MKKPDVNHIAQMIKRIEEQLLSGLSLVSDRPDEPVRVSVLPEPWKLLGTGNYAGVFAHPEHPHFAVKVYAPGRPGIEEEAEVYRRLGPHPAYSACYGGGSGFLLLKRLKGVTLYNCLIRGIPIPEQAVRDIDTALDYARSRGLRPHDIHAKNVMLQDGRGLIVDVSDFLKEEDCRMWEDFKRAYYRLYRPIASRWMFPVPGMVMEAVRKGYRLWRSRDSSS